MGSIEVDTSRLPILIVRYHGVVDDDAFRRYIEQVDAVALSGPRHISILDTRDSGITPAPQRRLQALWLRDNREKLTTQCLGNAFVIPSPLVRGVLTAILWVQPLPYPHVVVGSIREAEAWCARKISEAGVTINHSLAAP